MGHLALLTYVILASIPALTQEPSLAPYGPHNETPSYCPSHSE
jgi:hypothetical protein